MPSVFNEVSEVMVRRVARLSSKSRLVNAARVMVRKKIGSVVVVQDGRLVGIVTERDILHQAARGTDMQTRLGAVMTRPVVSCSPQTRIIDALELMKEKGVRHLPVTIGGELKGIVSLRDLLAASQLLSFYLI